MRDPPLRFECFLFDLDNTLIDTERVAVNFLLHAGAEQRAIQQSDLSCMSARQLLAKYVPLVDAESLEREFLCALSKAGNLHDAETAETLHQLTAAGCSVGLVTSSSREVATTILNAHGLAEPFARCLVTFETCAFVKPNPHPIQMAMGLLNADAARTLYIGDAIQDLAASRAAGTQFAFAGWSALQHADWHKGADYTLNRISDLIPLARKG